MRFCLYDNPSEPCDYEVTFLHVPGEGRAVGEPIYRSFDGTQWIGLHEALPLDVWQRGSGT